MMLSDKSQLKEAIEIKQHEKNELINKIEKMKTTQKETDADLELMINTSQWKLNMVDHSLQQLLYRWKWSYEIPKLLYKN